MNEQVIEKRFREMGADVEVFDLPASRRGRPFAVNLRNGKFELLGRPNVEFLVTHRDPKDRHLVLLAKDGETKGSFLCGHDERDWFVAAIPNRGVSSVDAAKQSLKPPRVVSAETGSLKRKKRHKRRNRAWKRQGEWFFIPAPKFDPPAAEILRHEPLSRGAGSKAHVCEEAWRGGGKTVYEVILDRGAQVVSYSEYMRLRRERGKDLFSVRQLLMDPEFYARGTVRHADHATLTLNGWHRVEMNEESNRSRVPHATTVMFLD